MNKVELNINLITLLHERILLGEHPLVDYVKRSDEEQYRLYQIGRTFDDKGNVLTEDRSKIVTNCDGKINRSDHQDGKAWDVFFEKDGKLVPPSCGYPALHKKWETWGGKPVIGWDECHFA